MDPDQIFKVFDTFWFNLNILETNPNNSLTSSNTQQITDTQNQENPSESLKSRTQSFHRRSMSDEFCSKPSFNLTSITPKLQTILSEKETTEDAVQQTKPVLKKSRFRRTRKQKGLSKSLSELEFEEVKGFIDLGFEFSEEDKKSDLAAIVPGLQRLGKKEGDKEESFGENLVSRPYLSEAWEGLEWRKNEKDKTVMKIRNWKVGDLSNETVVKDHLRCWAHNVASVVR